MTPSVLGAELATLTVDDSAPAPYNSLTSSLTGEGVPDVTLKPATASLGNTPIHTPSNASNFTLNNYELTALKISSITFTGANPGDFSQTGGTCGTPPTTVAANTSCTISVTFTPSVLGAESATLKVSDNAAVTQYQTLTSSLSGAGVPAAALAPASYNFGSVAVNTPSSPESFTLTNHQLVALRISSVTFKGANPGDFSQTGGTCGTAPTSLGAKSSCTVSVTFKPLATGKRTATLNVNDSANNSPQTVSLSGTGK